MRVAHLLTLAFLICTLAAFAQDKPGIPYSGPPIPSALVQFVPLNLPPAATAAEPWRILPEGVPDRNVSGSPLSRIQGESNPDALGKFVSMPAPNSHKLRIVVADNAQPLNDADCFYIRSYVVARDSKDSDATHLVKSSTCQPGSKYGLKTTELKQNSPSH